MGSAPMVTRPLPNAQLPSQTAHATRRPVSAPMVTRPSLNAQPPSQTAHATRRPVSALMVTRPSRNAQLPSPDANARKLETRPYALMETRPLMPAQHLPEPLDF